MSHKKTPKVNTAKEVSERKRKQLKHKNKPKKVKDKQININKFEQYKSLLGLFQLENELREYTKEKYEKDMGKNDKKGKTNTISVNDVFSWLHDTKYVNLSYPVKHLKMIVLVRYLLNKIKEEDRMEAYQKNCKSIAGSTVKHLFNFYIKNKQTKITASKCLNLVKYIYSMYMD